MQYIPSIFIQIHHTLSLIIITKTSTSNLHILFPYHVDLHLLQDVQITSLVLLLRRMYDFFLSHQQLIGHRLTVLSMLTLRWPYLFLSCLIFLLLHCLKEEEEEEKDAGKMYINFCFFQNNYLTSFLQLHVNLLLRKAGHFIMVFQRRKHHS